MKVCEQSRQHSKEKDLYNIENNNYIIIKYRYGESKMTKVHILWKFDTVGGGGNQFLRTLRRYWIKTSVYENDPTKADVILVNSKDCLKKVIKIKKNYRNKIVHRIDGIFSIYRGEHERYQDVKVYDFAEKYADGVIFQSKWSMNASEANGMKKHDNQTVILNCADSKYFHSSSAKIENAKVKIVTSSWSSNLKKGFDVYKFLDADLDYNKFDYSFAGRSPYLFKHIKSEGILSSERLAKLLQQADIFITATEDDACSNSIIEALACGTIVVGLNSGGTPEIVVSQNGEIFNSKKDVIVKIEEACIKLSNNEYNISTDSIEKVGKAYDDFMEKTNEQS